jgi:hypothetical protein
MGFLMEPYHKHYTTLIESKKMENPNLQNGTIHPLLLKNPTSRITKLGLYNYAP